MALPLNMRPSSALTACPYVRSNFTIQREPTLNADSGLVKCMNTGTPSPAASRGMNTRSTLPYYPSSAIASPNGQETNLVPALLPNLLHQRSVLPQLDAQIEPVDHAPQHDDLGHGAETPFRLPPFPLAPDDLPMPALALLPINLDL